MTQNRAITTSREDIAAAYRLYNDRKVAEAGALCAQILKHHPKQFDALYLNGLVAYLAGNRSAAKRLINRACRVRPEVTRFDHLTSYLRQLGRATWASVREARLHHYNWHRPHAGIKGNTPISRSGADVNNLMRLHI